jgi:hypothetical protein
VAFFHKPFRKPFEMLHFVAGYRFQLAPQFFVGRCVGMIEVLDECCVFFFYPFIIAS